jgi:predicted esterase
MLRLLPAIVCILLTFAGAAAQDWRAQFDTLISTQSEAERVSLIARIVSAGPDWHEVITEINSLIFPDTTKYQALMGTTTCIDGITRPYAIYVPSGYDPETPTPMLVHLHGVVMRPNIDSNPNEYVGNAAIMAEAERRGWIALFPFGQKGASWFDEVGMTNIMTQVRTIKSNFNIDDDRVYLSGISDGASAAFLFAMNKPTDFGAFVALNGTMGGGSEDGGFSTYAPNMANTYVYVSTADRDRYYPTSQMELAIRMAETAGAKILYHKLVGEHISSLAQIDYRDIFDYLEQHPRNSPPDSIVWETATQEFGVCNWLAIDEITIDEPAAWHVDHNVALVDSTISIGFQPYDTFPGPGVMVASLSSGDHLSKRIGLRPGDVIIKGNGISIDSLADINRFKSTLQRGSDVALVVRRGGSEIVLRGRMPAPKDYYIFERSQPSALVRATYVRNQFNIQGSRVGAFRLRIRPEMINLTRNVVVRFNGKKIFDNRVAPDIAYMLRDYLTNRDRRLVFVNEVALRPAN